MIPEPNPLQTVVLWAEVVALIVAVGLLVVLLV